jgi:dipeptidase
MNRSFNTFEKEHRMRSFSLKKILGVTFAALALFALTGAVSVQSLSPAKFMPPESEWDSCTSIMVGSKASTDGSVITCHSCDGNYRTWVEMVPGKKYKEGDMDPVYQGKLHTETPWDRRNMRQVGEIPQASSTYAYLDVAYPNMNEKGLAIGETTIGGRRELYNSEGLFLIEELERLALQRCTTAREAIKLIGEMAKQYGYGDRGECITIADNKEVWHFEIMGAGPLEIGAVWAAVRIPDEHVGVSANIPRIAEINLDDPDHYMASENVFSLAEEMGWYDPASGEPFKWWKAYGRTSREGNPYPPFSTREYFILSTMAPSLNLTPDMEELPFSVKPDKKVSVRDVMAYYRQTYAGTDLDSTKNLIVKTRSGREMKSPIAGPFMSRNLTQLINTIKPDTVPYSRTIAISGCSYSHVTQLRPGLPPEVGVISWFSFDNPGLSPRIPIFAGVTELPEGFQYCGQKRFRTDSACWAFRRANRLSTVDWNVAGPRIEGTVKEFEDQAFEELPGVDEKFMELYKENPKKARAFLTKYTGDFARTTMHRWWELGDEFWGRFARGF